MEWDVNSGNQDVGPLAAGDLAAALDLLFKRLQPTHRAGDRVLRATEVEVDDLHEFPSALGNLSDECGDVSIVKIDLRRADGSQPVVGPSLFVARHDVVHFAASVEHHFEQRLKFVHAGNAGQRGVLADRMPAGNSAFDEGALLAHLGDLCGRHRRHGDLGELRQVQNAFGMLVVHTGGDQARRVIANHVQHGKSKSRAGELVGAVPYLARGLGPGPHLHAHAFVLNTLARECVGGLRRRQSGRRRHDQLALDFGGDLQNLCAQIDSDPVHTEVDLIARHHHAQEAGRPAHQLAGRDRLTVSGGDHVLGRSRQPHAVHDRPVETSEQRRGPISVDGVVIARDLRERPHVDRGGEDDVATTAARCVGGILRDRSPGANRIGEFGRAGATTDRESLLKHRQHCAGGIADVDGDRHHPADLGVAGH